MNDSDKNSTRASVIAHPRMKLLESHPMEKPSPHLCETLLDAAPIGMATLDAQGKVTWCNQALAALTDKPAAELVGVTEGDMLEYPQGGGDSVHFPGTGRLAQRSSVQGGDGMAVFYVDITERDQLAKQLQQHDTVEPVSGLLNAQAISNSLEPLVSRSRRYDNPLSVVTMAITNLSTAADTDQAIVAVSQLLRDQLRWADMVGRNSDGHFVFVLPETDKEAAVALANKITAQLGGLAISDEGGRPFRPLACFGVAQWGRGDDSGLLLKRAADALDTATQQGDSAIAS